MLNDYLTATYRLLKDTNRLFYTVQEVTDYVNQSRYQVALLTGCIRLLVPGTAPFGSSAVPGSMIPGAGTPGASSTTFNTIPGVEKYSFSFGNAYARAQNQHIKGIGDVNQVTVNWGGSSPSSGIQPALDWMPWEDLNAYCRSYSVGVTSYPFVWSTYGDGERGQVWLFPIPTNALSMQWDCFCVPKDLTENYDYEALPAPYSEFVPFYAAHLAYLGSQRYGLADVMLQLFEKNSGLSRTGSDRGKTKSFYGSRR